MSCLNAIQGLNALELQMVESAPAEAKHVAIIGAGDGRLGRAIKEKLGDDTSLTLVESRESLLKYLNDFEGVGNEAFDVNWFKEQVSQKGPIDYLIYYSIHEYWQANLTDFRLILDQLSESGKAWVSFLNSHARNMLPYFLPQRVGSYTGLAQPARNASTVDYASWVAFLNVIGQTIETTWALLDPEAFEYCQAIAKPEGKKPADLEFDVQGIKMGIRNPQDAYMWGGVFIGLLVSPKKDEDSTASPSFKAAAFNPLLFQALIVPYPENAYRQVNDFMTETQVLNWKEKPEAEPNKVSKFLIDTIAEVGDVQSVLILGAGWGKDVFLFNREKPDWKVTGLDVSQHRASYAEEAFGKGTVDVSYFDPEDALPYDDGSFDVILTTGFLSNCHAPLVNHLVEQCMRVAKKAIFHFEDARGPSQSLLLKSLSLSEAYKLQGEEEKLSMNPVLLDEKQSGLMLARLIKD